MQIAELVNDSIVDGVGLRMAIFTQGCPHHCLGCHNPQTHDFSGGQTCTTDEIIAQFLRNPLLDGITLTGGEPFCQAADCAKLARAAKAHGLNVWAYTGYTLEQLLREADPGRLALLELVDVLVDGPFLLSERSLELRFRGSRNQRVLDMAATRQTGIPCILGASL